MLCLIFSAEAASSQIYSDLYEFGGTPDGCCPQYPATLAQGRDGNVYGITSTGGASNLGIVFQITPAGSFKIIHSFDGPHGSTPVGGLVLGVDGNLYGTTELGGAHGYGNIFKITPAGVLSVLYDFTGNADGGLTVAPLTLGTNGIFYGTSYPGVAFQISAGGVFKVINTIPTTSYGPLLQASDGYFYGVTEFGGTYSAGTVYKIAGKKVTTLYNFDGSHGSYPIGGLVQGSDGNLYGTTTAGGGTNAGVIYKITTGGTLTVVVDFDNVHTLAGYQAFAGLVAGSDGNLYGATIWGGMFGEGVIFQLTLGGSYTVLYSFDAAHGDGAYSTPFQHTDGEIFGMTKRGGTPGMGDIYSLDGGITPFASLVSTLGPVGKTVGILGQGFSGANSVEFNGTPASFHVVSNTYMTAKVPAGETGFVTITTSSGTLLSKQIFKVTPKVISVTPTSGKVGDPVVIAGTGLIQAIAIAVGGVRVTAFTVNSDAQVTFAVPTGAKTGKVVLTTPGGKATSKSVFTVTP
ncbi:MAG: choice-of-anchor tandem repeat GloVer-containing protein [Candidatus Sulfotelmatobacter sp.]